jgi:hypothetical protein
VTAWSAQRRGGFVAAVAARAEAWLFEPAAPRTAGSTLVAPPRPVVAVVGLARRCGSTTIARALAVELARRDALGAAVASAHSLASGATLATVPARRLARSLAGAGCETRAVGRLVLAAADDAELRDVADERPAPVVLDVPHGTPPEPALALADRAVIVASPDVEPSLVEVAGAALARDRQPCPVVVLNRAAEEEWTGVPAIAVRETRVGARLALAGRDPLGPLAAAVAAIADECSEAVVRA